jgi:hypothetical protein
MAMKQWIAAGLLTIASMQAHAGDFLTGNELYGYMTSNNTFENQTAIGYVMAIVDSGNGPGQTKHHWCFNVQDRVTGDQIRDIVKRFLEQNPNKRHFGAAGLSEAALAEAFPCMK